MSQGKFWKILRIRCQFENTEQCKAGIDKMVIKKSVPLQHCSAIAKTAFLYSASITHSLYVHHKTKTLK